MSLSPITPAIKQKCADLHFSRCLPWLVLAACLSVTYLLWKSAQQEASLELQTTFEYRALDTVNQISQQLKSYEQVLQGVKGLYLSSESVERAQFHNYIDALHLEETAPGILGVHFVDLVPAAQKTKYIDAVRRKGFPRFTITPDGKRETYCPVTFVEPFSKVNQKTLGIDTCAEEMQRGEKNRARDLGNTLMTGKTRLSTEMPTAPPVGVVIALPIYMNGMPHNTVGERRANLRGWVTATLRMDVLMDTILAGSRHDLDVEVYDSENMSDQTLLYDADNVRGFNTMSAFKFNLNKRISIADHTWSIAIYPLPGLSAHLDKKKPKLIAYGGLGISFLMAFLTGLLVRGRARAMKAAAQMNKNLIASEDRLKEAQHISRLGSWELNLITGELLWSDEIFQLFEIEKGHFPASYGAFLDAIHPEDRDMVNQAYARSLKTREPYEITHRLLLKGARIRWVTERCTSYFDADGKPIRSVGTVQDITERRQANDQLLIAAAAFETHEAIMITDADANIIRVNQAFEKTTGYTAEEVIGKNPRLLNSGCSDKDSHAAMWQKVLSTGTWSGDIWNSHKNGIIFPAHMTITAVKNEHGIPTHHVCIFSDISERKNAETALRQTENHFVTILDSLDEMIWSAKAPDFQLHHVSAAAEKLYGVSQQAFIDDPQLWFKAIHPDDKLRVHEATQQIFELGKTEIEYRVNRSDGQERWISDRMYVVYGANGEASELVGTAYDVTEYKLVEEARRKNQERLRFMLETSPIAVRIAASSGRKVLFSNKRYAELINADPDQIANIDPMQYYANPEDYENILRQLSHGTPVTDKLIELIIPGGGTKWTLASYLLLDYENEPAVLGWFYDVTDLRRAQEALQLSDQKTKQSLNELKHQKFALDKHAIVAVTDVQGRITYANQKFCEISGYTNEELIGRDHLILNSGHHPKGFFKEMYRVVGSGNVWHDEVCNRAKDGHLYWVDTTIAPYLGDDGKPVSYISIRTDISQRVAAEERSNYLALYDALTELPNRRLLADRLHQAIASSARHGNEGAILLIDLDNFKTLNDTLGHDMGDSLLKQVAQRLSDCMREGDTVARLGGDEFVVMLQNLSTNTHEAVYQTETAAEKILSTLNEPYLLGTHDYRVTPSIGATLFSGSQISSDEVMKRADIAMYQAKKAGRNGIRFFDPDMQATVESRSIIERSMAKALPQQQFRLFYQMQVDRTGKIHGAEVLLRWQHPDRGMISPVDFIPVAEETGMIVPIGQWVLESACGQLKTWENSANKRHIQLAVNVSARQFRQQDFVEMITRVLHQSGINPSLLKLELTESLVLDNVVETITKMNVLKTLGVKFSMDDFGTGHSSLSSLKKLPLDQLKIDQSFVRDIATDPDDAIIVQTIIAMARNLSMEVIAEGVETAVQRDFLIKQGCTNFQGYLFGRPVPLDEFEMLLNQG